MYVSYLFDFKIGWVLGRNVLFFVVMNRRLGYFYYIFLNDDIVLKYNIFIFISMRNILLFRVVEKWLLDYELVVGVLDYMFYNGVSVILKRR